MQAEIQQILEIAKKEQTLNAERHQEFLKERELNVQRHNEFLKERELNGERYNEFLKERELNLERHNEFLKERELNNHRYNEMMKVLTHEQELNNHRYREVKSSLDDIKGVLPTLATKAQLDQVYESLSEDITYLSNDHHKLKKRVILLERKF